MDIITIDFETFYDREYSLSKLSEAEYILDPRFEVIMCAVKLGDNPSRVYVGPEIAPALGKIDWPNSAMLAHNTRFDGAILRWHYGHDPGMYLDTLSMARATTHWEIGKSSLKALSEHLGLPPKGDEAVRAIGKRLRDFSADELADYKTYCARDNDNAFDIFQSLYPHVSEQELALIDMILRMFIEPQVQLDAEILVQHIDEVRCVKAAALDQVKGIGKSRFSSNPQFAELLREHGVIVPEKTSPRTGEKIPALARGDWGFKELCADPNLPPFVQVLLATRQSAKSTIDETRAEKFLRLSGLEWPSTTVSGEGWAPVPLKYSGARTHRLSGDGGINFQNIRRGSSLRKALVAPDGWRVVHRDASQIEARMVAWMAQCLDLLGAFDDPSCDVYCEFARIVYGRTITKADKLERFVGKTAILGLGYGCGAEKFRHMLFIGNGGISLKVSTDEAQVVVNAYRKLFPDITYLWSEVNKLLHSMVRGSPGLVGLLTRLPIKPKRDRLVLPSGLSVRYPGLGYTHSIEGTDITYDDPHGGKVKLYGAKAVENISQALARIVVTDIALRIRNATGFLPWLSTHDSLDYCVPEDEAAWLDGYLAEEFAMRPNWAGELPLASEGGWGRTLHDAERGANE